MNFISTNYRRIIANICVGNDPVPDIYFIDSANCTVKELSVRRQLVCFKWTVSEIISRRPRRKRRIISCDSPQNKPHLMCPIYDRRGASVQRYGTGLYTHPRRCISVTYVVLNVCLYHSVRLVFSSSYPVKVLESMQGESMGGVKRPRELLAGN